MDRRWHVSDFQRIILYVSVVAAVFLAAMALGWQNLWLLLAAAAVLVVVGGSVLVVAGRRGAGAREIVTARVLSVSSPPPNTGIAARCDMHLEVYLPGRGPIRTRHRDPAVPLTRWPQPGQTFPVEVTGGNPRRHLHIRWDLVEQGMMRAPDSSGPSAESRGATPSFVWEEENEPIVYSPTPPRPRRPAATSPSPPPPPPAEPDPVGPVSSTSVFLYETFTDLDEETVRTSAPPTVDRPSSPRPDPNGHDPDGYDPADFETPRLAPASPDPAPAVTGGPGFETVTLSDFDPAEVDIRDFTDEPPAVTTMPPDDGAPDDAPSPRPTTAPPTERVTPPSERVASPTERVEPAPGGSSPSGEATEPPARDTRPAPGAAQPSESAARSIPLPRDPGRAAHGGTGISATRTVADLQRSLRFYRDALGFTVAFAAADTAVVEHQGSRVLLERSDEIRPSSEEIHLDVTDIEATCAAVRENAGVVVEPPAPAHGGTGLQLWRARLRDPDGHAIEVIEWRDSQVS